MRCDAVRQIVEEGMTRSPAVEVHVESCASCREYLRQWERIQAGLIALRAETPPEPTWGFTTRLMRRLENTQVEVQFGQQLIDQIAMRVVYATLMVALMLALILALPSSGPLRSSGISESVFVQTQVATLANEQILGVDGLDASDAQDSSAASTSNSGPKAQGSK
jgi:anti-sigma factor RsiW